VNRIMHTGDAGAGGRMNHCTVFMFASFLLIVTALYAQAESAFLYTLTDLGTLGGQASRGEAINDQGWVVGESETVGGETRAFLWKPGGKMRSLGTLGGNVSRAFAINNQGWVVGESTTSDQTTRAFLWTEEDGMKPLSSGDGIRFSAAYAINDRGQVVGTQENQDGIHAVVWQEGRTKIIHRLPGSGYIQPLDVNERGDVAGQIETGTDENQISHAFYFRRALDAQNLSEFRLISPQSGSSAVSINDTGEAVGSIMSDSSRVRAFRYERATGVEILDDGDSHYSSASDLNQRGEIVGSSISSFTADETACLWHRGTWFNLNEVTDSLDGWSLTQALGINSTGQITGYGVFADDNRAYVLTPTGQTPDRWPSINITLAEHTESNDTERIIVIKADVINDVLIRRVIFYMNGQNLGSVEEPPYEWGWQGERDTEHECYAVMADNKGRIISSPKVRIP